MSQMFNPPHPAEILREDILPSLAITVTGAAKQLGVSRATLSQVLNEKTAISPEMALRIEAWLGVERGGRADLWLQMQAKYDICMEGERASKESPTICDTRYYLPCVCLEIRRRIYRIKSKSY